MPGKMRKSMNGEVSTVPCVVQNKARLEMPHVSYIEVSTQKISKS
jgi:hypothetical protein